MPKKKKKAKEQKAKAKAMASAEPGANSPGAAHASLQHNGAGNPHPRGGDGLGRLALTAQDALTDAMIERLAIAGGNFLEVADHLNDEETREAVNALLVHLTELHRTGALTTLVELVRLAHAAREAMTDSIIERLFAFGENMLNSVATEEMAELVDTIRVSLEDTLDEVRDPPKKTGMKQVYSLMKRPEGLQAMKFIITFVDKLNVRSKGGETGQHGGDDTLAQRGSAGADFSSATVMRE